MSSAIRLFCRCVVAVVCRLRRVVSGLRRATCALLGKVVELEAAEDDLDSIQQEIKMLQAFNCPQLTRYHGSFIVGR